MEDRLVERTVPWFASLDSSAARDEAAALTSELAASGASTPPSTVDGILAARAVAGAQRSVGSVPFTDHEVLTRAGSVKVRIFTPPAPARGACLAIHGGGWMVGGYDQEDAGMSGFAVGCGLVVASCDYRLAPEHPYPAAIDDCEAAALWFVEHCSEELGLDRLLISGGSAGAHLAVMTLLRLRDQHDLASAFRGAILAAGVYDLSKTPSQQQWRRDLVISGPMIDAMYDSFTPGLTSEERRDSGISPLYADLEDLPPTIFSVGTADPFLDDSVFLASRWRLAGNDAELHVLPEGVHGFAAFPLEITNLYNRANAAFIERVMR